MKVLDQFLNLFKPDGKALEEGQTAEPRLGQLRREFAEHPSIGITPDKLAALLAEAEQGDLAAQHHLFLDMEEKDSHLFAEMSKRRRALLSLPWRIVPPNNPTPAEKKAAETLAETVEELPDVEDIVLDLMDAAGHGFAALEIAWKRDGGLWLPANLEHRPQSWFTLDRETRTKFRLRDGSADGAELLPFGWVLHTHRAKPGYIARAGLHRVLSWPYLFKALSVRDLAELLEIYGIPMRLGTYQPGASDDDKRKLMAAVVGIGHRAAGIIPAGMAIEFKDAAKGSHQPFLEFATYMDRMISKAILGGTLTSGTDQGGGNRALGEVHDGVRRELLISDARQVQGSLTRDLLYPIAALNGWAGEGPKRAPRFEFVTDEETREANLGAFAQGVQTLVSLGTPVPVSWVQARTGIPVVEDNEPILAAPAASIPPPQGDGAGANGAASIAALAALSTPPAKPGDALDPLIQEAAGEWEEVMTPLVDPVQALFDEAAEQGLSAQDLLDRLPELLETMDGEQLRELLTKLAFTSRAGAVAGLNLE
jgi:phage gp29-like protein